MNVLIIDDQENVVNGMMKGIRWQELPVDRIWAAYNADEARQIIQRERVDILLCDIEMPGDDGLTLYRWAKEYDSRIECIFLTAHADFEFAKEAIRLNSFDYILQPAPYGEIEAAILRVCGKIRSETEQKRYSAYGKDFYENRDLLLDGFLQDWLSGNEADLERILRKLNQFQIDLTENASVAYCILQVIDWQKEERLESGLFRYAFSNILTELFAESGIRLLNVALGKDQYAILFYQCRGEKPPTGTVKKKLEMFQEMSWTYYTAQIACYMGTFGPLSGLQEQIHQVKRMQQDNVARQKGVFQKGNPAGRSSSVLTEMENWAMELVGGKAREVGEKAFRYLEQGMNAQSLKEFYLKFMQAVMSACEKQAISVDQFLGGQEGTEISVNAYQSIDGMKRMISLVTDYFDRSGKAEDNNYVETVIQYIHCNIEKDIRRSELAAMVNLNEDYLSRIFKKEKGISLKEYIILEKMRTARNLLKNTTFSVGMIGAQVGFDNFSHFSQMYKKVMGKTPAEEREDKQE
ncbi:MAG: response regulator [Eubacteriales bacterium]|nr:response regulator [Eubacteriales bacterium]